MRVPTFVLACLLAGAFAGPAAAATPTFSSPRPYMTSGFPADGLASGDINADGRAELVLSTTGVAGFLVGTASTGFASPTSLLVDPFPIFGPVDAANAVVADFNEDGFDDALSSNSATGAVVLAVADGFGLLNGCSCFGPGLSVVANTVTDGATGASNAVLAAGDLDLDGDLDLVVSDDTDEDIYMYAGNGYALDSAGLAAPTTLIGDVDFTGGTIGAIDDVVIANLDTTDPRPEIAVLFDDGSATLLETGPGPLVYSPLDLDPGGAGGASQRLAAGDVTGDGTADLVVSDPGGGQLVLYPGGSAFGAGPQTTALPNAGLLALGDLDADGIADLVVGTNTSTLQVFRGSPSGLTSVTTIGSGSVAPNAITTGDFDGDGRVDVVASFVEPLPYEEVVRYAKNTSVAGAGVSGSGALGSQPVGTIGPASSITITNTGAAPLKVTSIRSDSDDFIVSGETCIGQAIAAGATCSARVRFAPTATGARAGNLTLGGNTAAATVLALTGTGTAAPSGTTVTGPIGPAGPTGPAGPRGAPGNAPVSRGHARCRVRSRRIQCVVYNAKVKPWKFNEIRQGRIGNRRLAPGRYRLVVIHTDAKGKLDVYRRFVRVR